MQHIQDKEFDQLFRDRFEEAEIEPSANLWNKIELKKTEKKRRSFPIYWMAAALILVTISASLLFTKTEKIQLQGKLAMNVPVQTEITADPATVSIESEDIVSDAQAESAPLIIAPSINVDYKQVARPVEAGKRNVPAMQPKKDNDHLDNKQPDVKERVEIKNSDNPVSDPGLMMANANTQQNRPDEVINENDQADDKKGIRNIGDLVNLVVDKVDKREQKFLKFNTDDDDNSSLVAINIGFIKLNSRKHK